MADDAENKKAGNDSAEKEATSSANTETRDLLVDHANDLRDSDEQNKERTKKTEEPAEIDAGKSEADQAVTDLKKLFNKTDPNKKLDAVDVSDISNLTKDDGTLASIMGIVKKADKTAAVHDVATPAVQTGNLDANGKPVNDAATPAVQTGNLDANGKPVNDAATPAVQTGNLDANGKPVNDAATPAVQTGNLDANGKPVNDAATPAVQTGNLDANGKPVNDAATPAVQTGNLDANGKPVNDAATPAVQHETFDVAPNQRRDLLTAPVQTGTLDGNAVQKQEAMQAPVHNETFDVAPNQKRDLLNSPVQTEAHDANGKKLNDVATPAVQTQAFDATGKAPNDLAMTAVQTGTLDAPNDVATAAVQNGTVDAAGKAPNELASPAVQTGNLDVNGKAPNDLAATVVQTAALEASGKQPNDLATPAVQTQALEGATNNQKDLATPAVQNGSLDGTNDAEPAVNPANKLNLDFSPPPLTGAPVDSARSLQKAAVDSAAKEQSTELTNDQATTAANEIKDPAVDPAAETVQDPRPAVEGVPVNQDLVPAVQTRDTSGDVINTVDVAGLDRDTVNLEALVTTNNLTTDNSDVLNQIPVSDRPVVLARSINAVTDTVVNTELAAEGTEKRVDTVSEVVAPVDSGAATTPRTGMTFDALSAAAQTVKQSLRDRTSLEAVLRSIPPENKKEFEQIYKQNTGNDLRRDLTRNGLESSIALLNPKEEARNAAWLGDRLRDLSRLPASATAQRELIEHGIRSSLRTMTPEQRTDLSEELKTRPGNNGRGLMETLEASKLSKETKEIAGIINGSTGPTLSGAELARIADIGVRAGGNQGLTILKEALGGNSPEATAARQQFRSENGDQRLHNAFAGTFGGVTDNLRQARDYANLGKLDTATFIDMQRSNWANSDAGVELVARMMTQDERQRFAAGEKLAKENSAGRTPEEQEARQYYDRVHAAFQNAASSIGMISRWSTSNQNKAVTAWEDIAKHGELTVIGRMARAGNDFFADSPATVLGAMRDNMTNKDFNLMQDPSYRDAVYNMLGGRDGKGRSSFSPEASAAARQEIEKIFNRSSVSEAREANHASLREAASDRVQMHRVTEQYGRSSHSVTFDALRNGKASDFAQLSPQERRQLEQRVEQIPLNMRTEARAMLNELKANRDVTPTLARDLLNDALKNVPQNKIIERLIANQNNLPSNPQEMQALTKATRDALTVVAGNRSEQVFDRFAKPLLEGRGLSADSLREANMSSRVFGGDRLNHEAYYNQLKHLPQAERDRITNAAEGARRTPPDPEAQRTLDEAFKGMSQAERDIALNVLRNPNQEYTLSDRIRTHGIGGDVNQQALLTEFQALNRDAKMALINDHATKYQSFLPNDLARDAGESVKREIEMSLPMDRKDLERAMQDRIRETGTGAYGNVALTEISVAQTQDQMRSQLLDHLPPEQREQAQREIDQRFQALVNAIRRNDDAKDQYAKDLADKIVTVATSVVGGPLLSGGLRAANLAKLAVTAAGAVAARVGIEDAVRGEGTLSANDYLAAGIFGAADGLTMGRFGAAKNAFAPAVEKALASRLGAGGHEVRDQIVSNFDKYMARDGGEERLAAFLKEKGVADPEIAAREISQDVQGALNKYDADTAAGVRRTDADRAPVEPAPVEAVAQVERVAASTADVPARRELSESAAANARIIQELGQKEHISKRLLDSLAKLNETSDQTLRQLTERGILKPEQERVLRDNLAAEITRLNATTETTEAAKVLTRIAESNQQMQFLRNNIDNPDVAKAYHRMMEMSAAKPELRIPLDRLRDSNPEALKVYSQHMDEVGRRFERPTGSNVSGGDRYEYALQREIMDRLRTTNDPELKKWLFVPGAKNSTADRVGIDGVFINRETGAMMPINLKNDPGLKDANRYFAHFTDSNHPRYVPGQEPNPAQGSRGRLHYDQESTYSTLTGTLKNPLDRQQLEAQLRDFLQPSATRKPMENSSFMGAPNVQFPRLGDTPDPNSYHHLKAQADALRQYERDLANALGAENLFAKKAGAAVHHIETKELPPAAARRLGDIQRYNPSITPDDVKKMDGLSGALRREGAALTDNQLADLQQSFKRAGVEASPAEIARIAQVVKSGGDLGQAVTEATRDSLFRNLESHIAKLQSSTAAGDRALADIGATLKDSGSDQINREMASLMREAEEPKLRQLLENFYKNAPAASRQEHINRALELLK
ncbi:MAG: hypothetical protein K2X77_27115 [Candidatus Obscuribacterales bacterium]|nr:hypothetical protein [Candidatus Obscuribacterales bacterium]